MYGKRLIIMKFGGTSVGNAERFRQCAAIVGDAAEHDRILVVVSAMAGVTDLIFKTIEAARHGDAFATQVHLQRFESVHRELAASLFENERLTGANDYIAEVMAQLQSACQALTALRSDISAQTSDSLVAYRRMHIRMCAGRLSPATGDQCRVCPRGKRDCNGQQFWQRDTGY
jgi:aspartokinase/homoserine dehydrogenase 1